MPLTPGQILNNRYRIVKLLGQGGFGAVYRAWERESAPSRRAGSRTHVIHITGTRPTRITR